MVTITSNTSSNFGFSPDARHFLINYEKACSRREIVDTLETRLRHYGNTILESFSIIDPENPTLGDAVTCLAISIMEPLACVPSNFFCIHNSNPEVIELKVHKFPKTIRGLSNIVRRYRDDCSRISHLLSGFEETLEWDEFHGLNQA